jgi:hypothetical protein
MSVPRIATTTPATGERLAYLDTLKTALIAGIIVMHGFLGYAEFGSWPYQDVQEVTLSEVTETIVVLALSFGSAFLMGLFFLISGLLTPRSLERKGVRLFATHRLLRLHPVRRSRSPGGRSRCTRSGPLLHELYWYWFTDAADPFSTTGRVVHRGPARLLARLRVARHPAGRGPGRRARARTPWPSAPRSPWRASSCGCGSRSTPSRR